MDFIADLHIHSPYSRATSKLSHLHGLAAWAAIKGINVVGTGDFTHPGWLAHLQEHLEEAEPGFFRLKDTRHDLFSDVVPEGLEPDISNIRFVLTSEISSIYKRGGKVRKIHNILFAPDLNSVRRVSAALSAIGNLESDGRPILGLDSRNLLEILLENAPDGFLVPAHIWTPWFSLFGSKSGFDSIEECFGDLTSHIFALETGLSSDPDMNRTISALDKYSLISNSDCHSPSKLGREANLFTTGFDYFSIREALKNPLDDNGLQRFAGTIEFYPEEGKYHCDGHRKCKVCMEPQETREQKGICPECGKPVTVGVLYRVMELADRTTPEYPDGSPVVHSLVPLPELLSELLQVGPASKKVMRAYVRLIQQFGSEFSILMHTDIHALEQAVSSHFAEAIKRVRTGKVIRQPGYDGEFGVIRVFSESERNDFGGQKSLFESVDTVKPKKTKRRVKKIGITKLKKKTTPKNKPEELNHQQFEIVTSTSRHILVKAGPGTGKTHTLVQRLVRIAMEHKGQPCTVITFTNKAAKELSERIQKILGDIHVIHISTLHGYCLDWLRKAMPGINVAGPDMRKRYLRLRGEERALKNIKELDNEITTFLQQAPDLHKPAPDSIQPYLDMLESENLVDIDAVIPAFTAILKEQGVLARKIRQGTGHVFIDEFQDLNQSQYAMIKLIAETSPVFAIGDPDQAIYGFRGSSPNWFFRFAEELKAKQYTLSCNYRSAQAIVKAANKVIEHNPHPGVEVQNEAYANFAGKIFLNEANSPRQEAQYIVQQIEMLVGGTSHREIERIGQSAEIKDITLGDIAVLYRTTRQADILASTFHEHGLPVQVVDIVPYYLKPPIRPLYYMILLISGYAEPDHILSLLGDERISKSDLDTFESSLPKVSEDVLDSFIDCKHLWSNDIAVKLENMAALQENIQTVIGDQGVQGMVQLLAAEYNISVEDLDLIRFLRLAGNFGVDLDAFAKHLIFYNDSVVYDDRAESVTLMTLHAAKGLEFKVVFIVGLEEGLLPIKSRDNTSENVKQKHVEEERRLFYVGMTRAEEIVYLSHVVKRRSGSKDVQQVPSRFLGEIPGEMVASLKNPQQRKISGKKGKQLRLFD